MNLTIEVPEEYDICEETEYGNVAPELPFIFDHRRETGKKNKIEEKIVYLDLDETLVHCPRLSIWMKIFNYYNDMSIKENEEKLKDNIKIFLQMGGLRPGVKELFQTLNELLIMKKIDRIGIFTSASNRNNYVNYVKRCIEDLCEIPENTISFVITREFSTYYSRDGATIKDLYECYKLFYSIETSTELYENYGIKDAVILDDKPYNVAQFACGEYDKNIIGINQYKKDIPFLEFIKNIKLEWCDKNKIINLLKDGKVRNDEPLSKERTIVATILNDEVIYPYNFDYIDDGDMYKKIEIIKNRFMS